MIVELRGVGTWNKGAELMARAIVARLSAHKHVELAVAPGYGPYHKRAALGLLTKLADKRRVRSWLKAIVLRRGFRRTHGLVKESEVDAVVDASGFAYGDHWGSAPSRELEELTRRWQRRGIRVVLLPQAFGPFKDPVTRLAFASALARVDLAFARDEDSFAFAGELGSGRNHLRLAPDFTVPLKGHLPIDFTPDSERVWVVPNQRMLDKAEGTLAGAYLPFLARCIQTLEEWNIRSALLVHSQDDGGLVAELQTLCRAPLRVVHEEDPLCIKEILGTGRAVIASRYHALVSALAQNIPCMATGWSHKYATLLKEYGCPEMVVSPTDSVGELNRALQCLVGATGSHAIRGCLRRANAVRAVQIEHMWREVESLLGLPLSGESESPR
jgi:polysaccharide pyruvyl transferase WcaK-like protein